MNDQCFLLFLISGGVLVSALFVYWLNARKAFFDACDKYFKLTGKYHPTDFRNHDSSKIDWSPRR